ncbi:MAG: T9SS type A sorting domain-containing protein [Flavobacterium sp.]
MKKDLHTMLTKILSARLCLCAAFILTVTLGVNAQANLYVFSQSNGTYTALTAPTVLGTGTATADDNTYQVALPFDFTFNSVNYTSGTNISVNSNGFVAFGTTAPTGASYTPISATTAYAGAASAFGADISGSSIAANTGELSYETIGTAPTRTLVIQYKNFVRYANFAYVTADLLQFQIHLKEGSNVIQFVYGNFTVAASATVTVQVGLRGATNGVFANRLSTSSWTATTAGVANTAAVTVSSTVKPASGLTFTYTPPVPCTAPPVGGTAAASVTSSCATIAATTISLTDSQSGTGVTYQWQQSATGLAGSYTNVTGTGTNATYSATNVAVTTYYKALVTCSGQTTESTPVVVTVNSAIPNYATLPYTQGFENWISRCNNSEVPDGNWRATPATGNASWRRNDQGFTTAAWSFINDEPAPYPNTASQGTYSARFHSYGTTTGTGILDLFVDLSAGGTKTLTFDYVNPTGTDKLDILLSNDGGTTWETALIGTYTTSGGFSGKSATFTATSATSVLRFRATTDYGADDIGIDNLRLEVTPTCPAVGFNNTTAITSTSATVNFSGNSSANSYTFNYSPGGTAQTLNNDAPVNLSGLSPYTLYTVTIITNCAGGETSTATTTFRTAIGNDDCAGAVVLTPAPTPVAATYTSSGATSSGVTSTCTTALAGDVWFSFTATEANHTITVLPTFDFDAVIELRQGTCPGTNVACQDSSTVGGGDGIETMTATGLTVGTTYLLRVYSADANPLSGNFDISISGAAPAGTADLTRDSFTYYPNPVTSQLNLVASSAIKDITVYNLLGQKVITKTGNNNEETVDVSSLTAGTYMVSVQSENGMKQFKIVKN